MSVQNFWNDETGAITIDTVFYWPAAIGIALSVGLMAQEAVGLAGLKLAYGVNGQQLVLRDSFDNGMDDWVKITSHNKSEVISGGQMGSKEGDNYLKVRSGIISYTPPDLVAGDTYTISFTAEAYSGSAEKTTDFSYAVGGNTVESLTFRGNNQVEHFTHTFVADENSAQNAISLNVITGGREVGVDKFIITRELD